jgi:hypothetical protein
MCSPNLFAMIYTDFTLKTAQIDPIPTLRHWFLGKSTLPILSTISALINPGENLHKTK